MESNQIDFAGTMHHFFLTIVRIRQDLRKRVSKRLEIAGYDGLTLEMSQVIFCLKALDGSANQQEIADSLSKNKSSVTSLIDNLIKREMVTRKINPNDRRNNIIELSEKGYSFINEFYPSVYKTYDIEKIPMTIEEVEQLAQLLTKFIEL